MTISPRMLALAIIIFLTPSASAQENQPITRIAFGSCAKENRAQPIWQSIIAQKPELFLFIGDNIYADTRDMAVMKAKYQKLADQPGFKQLRESCPILATWDDHDYGANDAGVEYPKKKESQQVFLDFFGVPEDSPRRQREGVYHAEIFGPPGKQVQVIMLDTRYHRSPLKKGEFVPNLGSYVPNEDPDATILGKEQWAWLEEQLKKPAEVRIIASSIQVIPEDHRFEKWMNIPKERDRLFALIRETKAAGVVFISGDRHLAELSMMDGNVGYPLYDLTSSGLNQGSPNWRLLEPNRHRVGTMNSGNNFGMILLDWEAEEPAIEFEIRDEEGKITIRRRVPLDVLQPGKLPITGVDLEVVEGVLTPEEAAKHINAICTVEMKVQSTGQSRDKSVIYLNSKPNFRDPENFTVTLVVEKLNDAIPQLSRDLYADKTIRVTGPVTKNDFGPVLTITDAKKIKVVE